MFVSSSTLLCIYVFAMSALYMKFLIDDNQYTVWKAMRDSPASVILMAYCFISLWFVGGLTGFHLYLISTNQTTYENFRYRADGRSNVFDQGCMPNFLEVFCTTVPPSRNKFRACVEEMVPKPPPTAEFGIEVEDDSAGNRRAKVEDDLDIGGDLLKISQRRTYEEADVEMGVVRHSNGQTAIESEFDIEDDSGGPAPGPRSHVRNSSWGRRSGSWEISPEILAVSSSDNDNSRVVQLT